jgi:hypothetical protein
MPVQGLHLLSQDLVGGLLAEEHEEFADGTVDQLPFTDLLLTEDLCVAERSSALIESSMRERIGWRITCSDWEQGRKVSSPSIWTVAPRWWRQSWPF